MATLIQAARSGDQLETLHALRDLLARSLNRSRSGRDTAALSRQLTLVLAQIAGLEARVLTGTPLDELTRRRAARPRRQHDSGQPHHTERNA